MSLPLTLTTVALKIMAFLDLHLFEKTRESRWKRTVRFLSLSCFVCIDIYESF